MSDTSTAAHPRRTAAPAAGRPRRRGARAAVLIACGAVAVGGLVGTAPAASAAPGFQLPFPCGQTWSGQTRTNHSPANAVDFNRAGDLGDTVVAAASGRVVTVADRGATSYGRYVVVDHGSGWRTLYAHLSTQTVSVGQSVSAGKKLGTVGSTGGSTGPHLHFEELHDGVVQRVVLNGATALYWGTRSYTSHNSCGGSTGATGRVNTAGAPLTVRSAPSTSAGAVGSVADGATVSISCQTTGTSVTGTYGTSRVWDRIGSGRYVSDAYVFTGSDGRVAKAC